MGEAADAIEFGYLCVCGEVLDKDGGPQRLCDDCLQEEMDKLGE